MRHCATRHSLPDEHDDSIAALLQKSLSTALHQTGVHWGLPSRRPERRDAPQLSTNNDFNYQSQLMPPKITLLANPPGITAQSREKGALRSHLWRVVGKGKKVHQARPHQNRRAPAGMPCGYEQSASRMVGSSSLQTILPPPFSKCLPRHPSGFGGLDLLIRRNKKMPPRRAMDARIKALYEPLEAHHCEAFFSRPPGRKVPEREV